LINITSWMMPLAKCYKSVEISYVSYKDLILQKVRWKAINALNLLRKSQNFGTNLLKECRNYLWIKMGYPKQERTLLLGTFNNTAIKPYDSEICWTSMNLMVVVMMEEKEDQQFLLMLGSMLPATTTKAL